MGFSVHLSHSKHSSAPTVYVEDGLVHLQVKQVFLSKTHLKIRVNSTPPECILRVWLCAQFKSSSERCRCFSVIFFTTSQSMVLRHRSNTKLTFCTVTSTSLHRHYRSMHQSSSPQDHSSFMTSLQRVETCCHKADVLSVTVICSEDQVGQTLPDL